MIKIKGVHGAWPTVADAQEFLAAIAARGPDAWSACVGIPAAQIEFIEEGVAAPSMEIKTAFTEAVTAHDELVENEGGVELFHVAARPAFWTARAFDSLGNLLATANGATEDEAKKRAATIAAESAE